MDEKQMKELTDAVVMHGFDTKLLPQLLTKIVEGKKDFNLYQTGQIDGVETAANLSFHRSDKNDRVYFNNYTLSIKPEGPEGRELSRFMQIDYKRDFTLKELFNLMMERSVSKTLLDQEDKEWKPWVKMDFTAEPDKWGNYPITPVRGHGEFDVTEAMAKYPIMHLEDQTSRDHLKDILERGSKATVAFDLFERGGAFRPFSIEADPVYKNLIIRNPETLQIVPHEDLYVKSQGQGLGEQGMEKGLTSGKTQGETIEGKSVDRGGVEEPGEFKRPGMRR